MSAPTLYTADELRRWQCDAGLPDGRWVAARPMGWPGLALRLRLRLAWAVFTGRYDAVKWIDQ